MIVIGVGVLLGVRTVVAVSQRSNLMKLMMCVMFWRVEASWRILYDCTCSCVVRLADSRLELDTLGWLAPMWTSKTLIRL